MRIVALPVCEPCVAGEGEFCETEGCTFYNGSAPGAWTGARLVVPSGMEMVERAGEAIARHEHDDVLPDGCTWEGLGRGRAEWAAAALEAAMPGVLDDLPPAPGTERYARACTVLFSGRFDHLTASDARVLINGDEPLT